MESTQLDLTTYEGLLAAIAPAEGAPSREVTDPATGEVIGLVPVQTPADVDAAITRAEAAQPAWEALGHEERSAALLRAADAVERSAEALARISSRESGKPLNGPGARFEAGACAIWLRTAAATQLDPQVVVDDESGHAVLHYRAIGVVGAITPWNWPMMIAVWQIAPSLRMGNTVVIKPSEYTTLCGLAIAAVINQELPEGVLEVVTGAGDIGGVLTADPRIGKVMFTGSTATGKRIIGATADNLTRLTLELGGNDPGIVLPDADPKAIAEGLFWGAFINTGQTCAALKRLYVHDSIYDAVVDELAAFAAAIPMGPGVEEQNLLGPLQNAKQREIVAKLVDEAKASGARVVLGGEPDADAPGYFYPTTIVADVDPSNPLVVEEQFGPALPVIRYSDVDEAIAEANRLNVGLGSSVWSSDPARAREVAARIKAGTTWINAHGALHPIVPFGGVKGSGYGLEFGPEGLKAVAYPHVING